MRRRRPTRRRIKGKSETNFEGGIVSSPTLPRSLAEPCRASRSLFWPTQCIARLFLRALRLLAAPGASTFRSNCFRPPPALQHTENRSLVFFRKMLRWGLAPAESGARQNGVVRYTLTRLRASRARGGRHLVPYGTGEDCWRVCAWTWKCCMLLTCPCYCINVPLSPADG